MKPPRSAEVKSARSFYLHSNRGLLGRDAAKSCRS